MLEARYQLQTAGNSLNLVYTNPKARFQLTFLVYRVSGQGTRRFLLPEIGIRAVQGHSARDDIGTDF
jgi:RNA:NAD 2'-phosphotransferase (TPT1/KptA family)